MTSEDIAKLIERRRRQVLVNSVIYYVFDDNLITDDTWNRWANELDDLQKRYPDIAKEVWYADVFKDFDPCTGHSLPLDDPWAVNKARYLLNCRREELLRRIDG